MVADFGETTVIGSMVPFAVIDESSQRTFTGTPESEKRSSICGEPVRQFDWLVCRAEVSLGFPVRWTEAVHSNRIYQPLAGAPGFYQHRSAADESYSLGVVVCGSHSGEKESRMVESVKETWSSGDAYEQYVGRWSRAVAREFLGWLNVDPGLAWGDVGCGTGALAESILMRSEPTSIIAIDRAEGFIRSARERVKDPRVQFVVGDALALMWPANSCDATVSGLVLNFVSDPQAMVIEMVRVTRPGGTVGAYVWDYGGGMQMLRHFWDAAVQINPHDSKLDQAERFPICQREPLETLFRKIGLNSVSVRAIDIATVFRNFEDYWTPFLGEQGAAPTYLASLDAAARDRIRDTLKARIGTSADGSIALTARAWAVQGKVPPNKLQQ